MTVLGLQKRLYGSTNRICWRGEDLSRLAKHFGHTGPVPMAPAKRDATPLVVDLTGTIERSAQEQSAYLFTISTAGTDLMHDQISVGGWDLTVYRGNSIVQYAHNGDMLPIGRAVSTGIEGGRLMSRMVFSSDTFALRVRRMIDEGALRGASVGFLPRDWKFSSDPSRPGGIDFTTGHRLLEWSIVNLPCNPACLFHGSAAHDSRSAPSPVLGRDPTPYADAAGARLAGMSRGARAGLSDAVGRRLSEIRARTR